MDLVSILIVHAIKMIKSYFKAVVFACNLYYLQRLNPLLPPPPQAYMGVLEREVGELSGRVAACRQCLLPTQRSQALCGGGPGWRDAKQRAKHIRRMQRAQKKGRAKKKGNKKTVVPQVAADAPASPDTLDLNDILLSDVNQDIT